MSTTIRVGPYIAKPKYRGSTGARSKHIQQQIADAIVLGRRRLDAGQQKTPGVEVRPLVLMDGHSYFNEVFFNDVQIPKESLVSSKNEGWKVSITPAFERASGAPGGGHSARVKRLIQLSRKVLIAGAPAWDPAWVRQKLVQFIIEGEAIKYARLRGLTRRLGGQPPAPEGSMLKLVGSELGVRNLTFRNRTARCSCAGKLSACLLQDAPR